VAVSAALPDFAVTGQKAHLKDVTGKIEALLGALDVLHKTHEGAHSIEDPKGEAYHYNQKVIPAMKDVRNIADALENVVDDALWPLPKYSEILFLR